MSGDGRRRSMAWQQPGAGGEPVPAASTMPQIKSTQVQT